MQRADVGEDSGVRKVTRNEFLVIGLNAGGHCPLRLELRLIALQLSF
jgi:hypothetical protein